MLDRSSRLDCLSRVHVTAISLTRIGRVQTCAERERSPETMSNPDFLFSLALHFDDDAIAALRAEPGPFTPILANHYLWYKRTELLCSSKLERDVELQQRPGVDWEAVYNCIRTLPNLLHPYLSADMNGVAMSVLLELGYDPSDGTSLLSSIVGRKRDVSLVLFEDGRSDPAVCDEDGDTALHYTVGRGDIEFTRLLLADTRTDPDQLNESEYGDSTPIEEACRWIGEQDESNWKAIGACIQLVLDDPRTRDFDGSTALDLSDCNPVITQIVIRAWMRDGRDHTGELESLCSQGKAGVVALLLKYCKCDPTRNDSHCLRLAVDHRRSSVVKVLLSDGRADPRADNDYCIEEASAAGDFETVAALLSDLRVISDPNNDAPLRLAQEGGHTAVVIMLQNWKQARTVTRRRRGTRCA